jgi:transcriptional activator of cad operon
MTKPDYQPFELGDWLVEPEFDRISRDGAHVSIQPKAMELLVYLARSNGHVVSADEILDDLWGKRSVDRSRVPSICRG